jgi:hypothetical protein
MLQEEVCLKFATGVLREDFKLHDVAKVAIVLGLAGVDQGFFGKSWRTENT